MAAMTLVGIGTVVGSPLAYAVENGRNGGSNGDTVATEIERNNELDQSIEQDQEACTNELKADVSDDDLIDIGGDNEAEADQTNICAVTQAQTGANVGTVTDNSNNEIGLESILANVGLDL